MIVPSHEMSFDYFEKINFKSIDGLAKKFASHIRKNFSEIKSILLKYESYEVVRDETDRTLDLLTHLKENKIFMGRRIGPVTTFLPKNQPLYSLACFVVVPSLMATEVHFRPPHAMKFFYEDFIRVLKLKNFFRNVFVSNLERLDFLKERTASVLDNNGYRSSITQAVIFTGTKDNADKLRNAFDKDVLLIANGSGHNPIVVTESANLKKAVDSAISVQLYNQGQDCASPNSILVHKKIYQKFLFLLKQELSKVRCGRYEDTRNRIGPISEKKELVRIQSILVENARWIDSETPGIIRSKEGIVEPVILCRPLIHGGNFKEIFAPIFFVQRYDSDSQLKLYFEDPQYAPHAMYIALFGSSKYVQSLVGRPIEGRILHTSDSIIRNSDSHAIGFERGTQEYGGLGVGASSVSINGKIIAKPTLPQRDLYQFLVKPFLRKKNYLLKCTTKKKQRIIYKDLERFFGLSKVGGASDCAILKKDIYYDARELGLKNQFFIKLKQDHTHFLLHDKNHAHVKKMSPESISAVRKLSTQLMRGVSSEEIQGLLYSIPIRKEFREEENKKLQKEFFVDLYNLLLGKSHGPRLHVFIHSIDPER